MADGVDEETWTHHLKHGDYSDWIRHAIKDEGLADQINATEQDETLTASESLRSISAAIEQRYTLPATESPPDTPKASKREGSAR